MEPFGQVEDVQRRLDFTLDDAEQSAVEAALEDLSEEARYYAGREWPDPSTAPNLVRTTVVKAVRRWARNMNAYVQSRAGDETLTWSDLGPEAGAPEFLPKEIKLLKALGDGRAGAYGIGSVELTAYTPANRVVDDGRVMVAGGGTKTFPFNLPNGQVW